MKKLILILLFFTGFLQAQTLQNPTFGITTTNNLKIKANSQDNTAAKMQVQSADGTSNWINKIDLINQTITESYNTRINVDYPDKFTFRPFNIYEKNGTYFTDFKVENLVKDKISNMTPYYVDFAAGSDSNNGTTPATAFKTISYAYSVGARLLYLSKGVHLSSWGSLNGSYVNTDDFFVIGASDGVSIVTNAPATAPTFSLVSGSAYSAAVTSNTLAVDLKYSDSYGFPFKLKEVFTQAECIAELGTFYKNANIITVNLKDGRTPDSNVLIPASTSNADYSANAGYHYVKGITFIGGGFSSGSHGSDSQEGSNSTLVALSENCRFLYAQSSTYIGNGGEGSRNRYNRLTMFENCVAYGNSRDGYNYVSDNANNMGIVEINCQAFNNGLRGTSNSVNGSSSHQIANILRLNCKYYNNYGPNVADQGGGITYNVGVESFNSAVPSNDTACIDFNIQPLTGSTSYMYNRGCSAYGSVYSFRISGTTPAYMVNVGNHYGGLISINTPSAPQTITFADAFTTSIVPAYVFPALSSYTSNTAYAPLESPSFTGTPTAPTAIVGTNTAQIATAALVFATDANNIKTTGNQIKSGYLYTNSSGGFGFIADNTSVNSSDPVIIRKSGKMAFMLNTNGGSQRYAIFDGSTITGTDKTFTFPNVSGTIALEKYKVYTALVSQSGTSAPTVTVLGDNTIGSISWTRSTTGTYVGTLTGVFTNAKTICFINNTVSGSLTLQRSTDNTVTLTTADLTGTLLDGRLNNNSIEIRVYP